MSDRFLPLQSRPMGRINRPGLRSLGALAVLCLFATGASGQTDRRRPEAPLAPDEMVGTLPATAGWSGPNLGTAVSTTRAMLYLEGAAQRVLEVVSASGGSGSVVLERLPFGEVRATFRGPVQLDLHPLAFDDGLLRAGVLFGSHSGVASLAVVYGARMVTRTSLHPWQALPVPMAQLVDSGALQLGLSIVTASPLEGRSVITMVQEAAKLRIIQAF
jgi:hypothetical protein